MKTLTFISYILGIGIALSACGSDGILLGELIVAAERGDGDDGPVAPDEPAPDEPSNSYPTEPSDPPGNDDEAQVVDILLYYCGACHDGPRESSGGFEVIGDIDAVVAYGMIVPGDKEGSRVYQRMLDGTMPPISVDVPRPTDEETEFVGSFIDDME